MPLLEVLRCPSCGVPRDFSPEHENRMRTGKAPLTLCRDCRRPQPKPSERDRQWWRDRFTPEELTAMAEALFVSRKTRGRSRSDPA